MTTSKRAATRKGGGSSAAKAEKNGVPPTFKFRNVELKTPAVIPDTFGFDLGELQMHAEDGNEAAVIGGVQRLLGELLGREELRKVRDVVKGPDDPWQKELLEKTLGAHDLTTGEASASASS